MRIKNFFVILVYIIGFSFPLVLFLGRVLIPDTAFDTINYHTFLGARGWDGLRYSNLEFFPTGMHSFFPLFDMVNNLGMKLLGYRLGTLTQLLFFYLSILLSLLIIKSLKLSTGDKLLDALLHVNIFISLEALFQISSYFTDILSLFSVLLCIFAVIKFKKTGKSFFLYISTLVISVAVLCKYTNYIYFLPYFFLLLVDVIKEKKSFFKIIKVLIPHVLIFMVINAPWMIWNYYYTQNPVFPYFNSVFKSPYFQPVSWQFNFGPKSIVETIFYPIYLLFDNSMLGEYHELYSDYKIAIYIILLFFSFPIFRRHRDENPEVWYLYLFDVLVYILWVLLFGYARYFMAWEFILGILLIPLFSMISKDGNKSKKIKIVLALALLLIYWQNGYFVTTNFKSDISWRPNLWSDRQNYMQEYENLVNNSYAYSDVGDVDFYINCGWPNVGYMVPSNMIELPVITLTDKNNETQYERTYRYRALDAFSDDEDGELVFVTVLKTEGRDASFDYCMPILDAYNATILDSAEINFLGYDKINLIIIKGSLQIENLFN